MRKATDRLLKTMVRRLVDEFQPEQVILFGSHGRGEGTPDSDVDLLVVLPEVKSRLEAALAMRMAVRDCDVAKDIVVTTTEDMRRRRDVVGTIEYPAAHEGKVLYARRR